MTLFLERPVIEYIIKKNKRLANQSYRRRRQYGNNNQQDDLMKLETQQGSLRYK